MDEASKLDSATGPASVLVVEDEVLIRMLLADEIRALGYTVVEAANADEAVTVLTSGTWVDLMLTDIQMPGVMDGIALATFVRRAYPGVKVVVASGRADEVRRSAVQVDAIFTKPYDIWGIIAAVRRLIGQEQPLTGRVDRA